MNIKGIKTYSNIWLPITDLSCQSKWIKNDLNLQISYSKLLCLSQEIEFHLLLTRTKMADWRLRNGTWHCFVGSMKERWLLSWQDGPSLSKIFLSRRLVEKKNGCECPQTLVFSVFTDTPKWWEKLLNRKKSHYGHVFAVNKIVIISRH